VVIEDDLVVGFDKLDKLLADKPRAPAAPLTSTASEFKFRGGPRYTPMLLAIVLPFVWLLALYLMLSHLLSQHSLTLEQAKDSRAEIEALGHELQALRSEIAGAPRSAKSKPAKRDKPKPAEAPPLEAADVDEPTEPPATPAPAIAPKPVAADPTKSPTGGPNFSGPSGPR
jgi:hypothetical protein